MDLIGQYIADSKLVNHQIVTYNDFITRGIQTIVDREGPVVISASDNAAGGAPSSASYEILFGQVYVANPRFIFSNRTTGPLYPNEAKKRYISYEGTCYVNIDVRASPTRVDHHVRVPIGKIPVMVGSCVCNLTHQNAIENEECENDPGGYFVIKGKERVLVAQLRQAYNKVYVFENKASDEKFSHVAEMRSVNAQGSSVLIQAKIDDRFNAVLSLPYVKALLPAGIVFRALGLESEDDLIRYVSCGVEQPSEIIEPLLRQFRSVGSKADALERINAIAPPASGLNIHHHQQKREMDYETVISEECFYHVGNGDRVDTCRHLGYILKHLYATATGNRAVDDKHNLSNKRLDGVASLMEFLFQSLFKQFVKNMQTQLRLKKNPHHITVIKSIHVITHGFTTCFMTGSWSTQKSASGFVRIGVSQVLSTQNYGARISHLRRVAIPMGTKGKNFSARHLHASHFSFFCPYETPEGENVGLVENLSLTAEITTEIEACQVRDVIERRFKSFTRSNPYTGAPILLNGTLIGSTESGVQFRKEFESFRASDEIDDRVSIVFARHLNEIHIETDAGRIVRPLFDVAKLKEYVRGVTTYAECVRRKIVVFRSAWELEQSVVAMDETDLKLNKCHYAEICPAATIMGIMAAVIPFANHSQSPRNAYQSNMGKQAIGVPFQSFQRRYDTSVHIIDYAQSPITRNAIIPIVKFNEMSHGAMPVVAISTHCGFNQEDSVILNKSSIDRGLFLAHTYKTIVEEEKKKGNADFETICAPKYEYRRRDYNYSYIGEDGIVRYKPQIWLRQGDVIIGKTCTKSTATKGVLKTTDASVVIKHDEEGYLDSVLDTLSNEGIRVIKIRVRIPRIPEMGDKFASSTAQKGTCGMIFAQEDMPFDPKTGIVPDLIINPHAIPSRMTINMLIEMSLNLVGCVDGTFPDATTFAHPNIEEELDGYLERLGWDSYASTLHSGMTGERYASKIFMAPAFYQRLKHMVADKIHSRVAGPLDTLTHQPVAGRSRDGGLRFGEMERDCMLAHGSTRILKECLFDQSDKYEINICSTCGVIAQSREYCKSCEGDSVISRKNMPYATKLFFQQIMGMGLKLQIK